MNYLVMGGIREHFRCKNFGFRVEVNEADLFLTIQYSERRLFHLIYRSMMFLYQSGWFLAYYIYQGVNNPAGLQNSYLYLTLWGNAINMMYFTLSFILAVIGYVNRDSLTLNYNTGFAIFRSVVWWIHSIGQTSAIIITIIYWASLAPSAVEPLNDPFNINLHAINSVLYLIEVFVVAYPIRLMHFVHPMILGLIYVTATLIYYGAGITSAVYPILNWEETPGIAVAYSLGCILGCIVIHTLMFCLHLLRILIAKRCGRTWLGNSSSSRINQSYGNNAYDISQDV